MSIEIAVSKEEKDSVINAINLLNSLKHIKSMSQALIATTAGIKPTKVRVILQVLIDEKSIKQYDISNREKRKCYYYIVNTEIGTVAE